MRKKQVWRYYCDYCKKSGCSGGWIAKHEKHCTMNPDRECGMCKHAAGEEVQPNTDKLIAMLPDPTEYHTAFIDEFGLQREEWPGLSEAVDKVLPALRESANNCPVCLLAAFRQRGIHLSLVENFEYKDELASLWAEVNAEAAEAAERDCYLL